MRLDVEINPKTKNRSEALIEEISAEKTDGSIYNKIFRTDCKTFKRTEIEEYKTNENKKESLFDYGLDKYYGEYKDGTLYIYNNKDKLINEFTYPNWDKSIITGGKFIYQNVEEVEDTSEDFTYIDSGKKYKLISKQKDFLTSEEKELNLDYKIIDLKPFKSKTGRVTYAYGKVKKIVDGSLALEDSYVIINNKGKILDEREDDLLGRVYKFGDKYIDYETWTLYDKNLKQFHKFEESVSSRPEGYFVLRKDGKLGMLDTNLETIIPYEYDSIEKSFVDGNILAITPNNKYFVYNKAGEAKELINIYQNKFVISNGLIFTYEINEELNKTTAKIIDYEDNVKYTNTFNSFKEYETSNFYGEYYVYLMEDDTEVKCVLVNVSTDKY